MIDLALARLFDNADLDVMENGMIYCLAFSFESLVQKLMNFISWCIFVSSRALKTSNLEIMMIRRLYVEL